MIPTTEAPTPNPWFPIYDPFIYGDNSNYATQDTCRSEVPSDLNVTSLYLAVRDNYPTKALKHTRVLALSGMTAESLELFHQSLMLQDLSSDPIDLYIYSDLLLLHEVTADLAEGLISLSKYTYPSTIVFGRGTFKREGLYSMLSWMYNNREGNYFKNLQTLQVSEHQIVDYDINQSYLGESYLVNLTNSIVTLLHNMCTDKTYFPVLHTLNFNQNGYDNDFTDFASQLLSACNSTVTGVTVFAEQNAYITFPTFCMSNLNGTQANNAPYYNMEDEKEVAQCRYTWNWEYGGNINNSNAGPYPNVNSPDC